MAWKFIGDVPVENEQDRKNIIAEYLQAMCETKGWFILMKLTEDAIFQEHLRLETCAPDALQKIQGRIEGMKMMTVMAEEKIREGRHGA